MAPAKPRDRNALKQTKGKVNGKVSGKVNEMGEESRRDGGRPHWKRASEDDALPCPRADQFFDDNLGECGLCEDICRDVRVNRDQCQLKCPKYYRGMVSSIGLTTTLSSIFVLPSNNVTPYRTDTPMTTDKALGPSNNSPHLTMIVTVTCVVVMILIIVCTFVLVILYRRSRKPKTQSVSQDKNQVELQPLNNGHVTSIDAKSLNSATESVLMASLRDRPLDPNAPYYGPDTYAAISPPQYKRSESRESQTENISGDEYVDRRREHHWSEKSKNLSEKSKGFDSEPTHSSLCQKDLCA